MSEEVFVSVPRGDGRPLALLGNRLTSPPLARDRVDRSPERWILTTAWCFSGIQGLPY